MIVFFFVDATLDSYVHCYMVRHRLSNIPLWLQSEMRTHIQQVQTACSHFVENASVFLEVFRGTLVRHVTFFAKTAKQHKCRVEKHQVYFCVDSAPPIHTVTWASGGVSSRHITWSPDESTAMSFAFAVTPCIDILKTPTQLPVAPSLVCILWSWTSEIHIRSSGPVESSGVLANLWSVSQKPCFFIFPMLLPKWHEPLGSERFHWTKIVFLCSWKTVDWTKISD